MQNAKDFEERIIHAKKEIAALLAREREFSTGTHLQHTINITARCQRTHPAAQGREPLNRKERANYNQQVRLAEERLLEQWAKDNNLWVNEGDFNKQYVNLFLDEGAEQKVYLNKTGKTVSKVNTGIYHGAWLEFFIRLLLHQTIFPSTAYLLTGFTEIESQFSAILAQPFVDVATGATPQFIGSFLLPLRFVNVRACDYYNRKHGILLEDLHDENVFRDKQGVLYFIDPVIYLETPDLGLNGPTQFHFPF